MCSTCVSPSYGQSQPEAIKQDKAKLDKVRKRMEQLAQRKANAHLN